MRKCAKADCQKEATRALKLFFHASLNDTPAIAFISLRVCDEHHLNDEEMKWLLETNWKALCAGFTQNAKPLPVRELTKWEWVPLKEAEEFWKEGFTPISQRNALNN